jgi:hypothetical protein
MSSTAGANIPVQHQQQQQQQQQRQQQLQLQQHCTFMTAQPARPVHPCLPPYINSPHAIIPHINDHYYGFNDRPLPVELPLPLPLPLPAPPQGFYGYPGVTYAPPTLAGAHSGTREVSTGAAAIAGGIDPNRFAGTSPISFSDDLSQVSTFPAKFFSAFNDGDMRALCKVVDKHCTRDVVHRTNTCDRAYSGRDFIKTLYTTVGQTHPDFVFLMKDTKVVNSVGGKVILVVKTYFTGTRVIHEKSIIEDMHGSGSDSSTMFTQGFLDLSSIPAAKREEMTATAARCFSENKPIRVFGKALFYFTLNERRKVVEFYNEISVSSVSAVEEKQANDGGRTDNAVDSDTTSTTTTATASPHK